MKLFCGQRTTVGVRNGNTRCCAQWRKVKLVQSMWVSIFPVGGFEETQMKTCRLSCSRRSTFEVEDGNTKVKVGAALRWRWVRWRWTRWRWARWKRVRWRQAGWRRAGWRQTGWRRAGWRWTRWRWARKCPCSGFQPPSLAHSTLQS